MRIRNIVSAIAACAVAAAALVVPTSAEDSYTAAITFQSSSYMFRDDIAQSQLLVWDDEIDEAVDVEGASYTDATITGDGTYTVELNGIKDGGWNMLKLETNIDLDATPDIKLELVDVELNGASVDFDKDAAAMSEGAATKSGGYSDWEFNIANTGRIQLINTYDNLAAIPNDSYESVKVTFTVSGMSAADASDATDAGSNAATGADKGSPDTGVEGIAAVAGLAVVAAGALAISRKRK
ncbi:MAG: NPXTG-anchored protein [Oscillospiraceae bacterium]|nr:NPXTG-anchored protein [Oscillospiraceae bacterium]